MSCADLIETNKMSKYNLSPSRTHIHTQMCLWITFLISFIQSVFAFHALCLIFRFFFVFVIHHKIHKHPQSCMEEKKNPPPYFLLFLFFGGFLLLPLLLPFLHSHTLDSLSSLFYLEGQRQREKEKKK